MAETDIIEYANQHLVYLREGDYWPEPLSNMNGGKGVETVEQLNEMLALGTVYPNKAVAKIISDQVRKLLNRTALELFVFGQGQNNNSVNDKASIDIRQYADLSMWYLGEGDHLPRPLSRMNNGNGSGSRDFLSEMRRLGTLYPNKAAATIASDRVRAFLSQAFFEQCASSHRPY